MKIGSKYQIRSDSMNIIVSRKRTRTRKVTGEKYQDWEDIGYFATTANALKFLFGQQVKATGFKDLETVKKRIDQVEAMIGQALQASESHTGRRKQGKW